MILLPVFCSNLRRTSAGIGAAPVTQTLIDVRSNESTFGWAISAIWMAGTPGKRVGFFFFYRFYEISFLL